MEATFVVDLTHNQQEFVERFVKFFGGKKIRISVEELKEESGPTNQQEIFRKMEETRKQLKTIQVPPDLDINQLIDEMYDQPL